tara:strand:+ start:336 stop:542 length:207 start_codon:yes stop_codon:yes gene_type:complete
MAAKKKVNKDSTKQDKMELRMKELEDSMYALKTSTADQLELKKGYNELYDWIQKVDTLVERIKTRMGL